MGDFTNDRQSFTGARGVLKLDGKTFFDVENIACSWQNNYVAHKPCGSFLVKEHVPVGRFVQSLTVSRVKRLGADFTEWGLEAHDLPQVMAVREMTMVITDEVTGGTIYTIVGCKLQAGDFRMDANGLVIDGASFVAIDVRTELESDTA